MSEKPIVEINTGRRIEVTFLRLLQALHEAGVIELKGDYAAQIINGTAKIAGWQPDGSSVDMKGKEK